MGIILFNDMERIKEWMVDMKLCFRPLMGIILFNVPTTQFERDALY